MKRAAFVSTLAFLLVVAAAAPVHAADVQPTPPPIRDLTPASATPPAAGITWPHSPGSTCTGWYLQKDYGYNWPAATTWWEAECDAYDPSCFPACEPAGNVALLVDFYYWDGSTAIFYGEQYYQDWSVGTTCMYWLDSATGLQYQYDTPTCPWTGPGNAAPFPGFRITCSAVYNCTFDGSDSFASDGVASYRWDFGDGSTSDVEMAQHSYAATGTYIARLTVIDNGGLVAATSTAVRIDIPPIASFTYACSGSTCTFDASASSDPDGTVERYYWNFGDGPATWFATPMAQHTYVQAGSYTVTLLVVDDGGASTSAQQTAVVSNLDIPPTAAFTSNCAALACSFDGSVSADPDGSIQAYSWNFGDGGTATTAAAQHTYVNAGTYTVTLAVTDDAGLVGTTSKTVTVVATVPTASFSVTCAGGACTFDASGSTDLGGTITAYEWTFGDGATGQGKVVSHSYSSTGTYNATLTVTDSGGIITSTSKTASSIQLTATVAKVKSLRQVSLTWAGSNATGFEVYRNGVWIATVVGTSYVEAFSKSGTYTYRVCEANKSICSNSMTVSV